ncbi:hypothetical protein MBLNU457_6694t1 [Dothideomycetes sp. NU457]
MANPYEFRESDIAGMGTFATLTIRRGQRIMSCRPLILNRTWRSVPTSQTLREILSWEDDSKKASEEAELQKMTVNARCSEEVRGISNRIEYFDPDVLDKVFDDSRSCTTGKDKRPLAVKELQAVLYEASDVERSPDMQLRMAKFLCNRLFLDGNSTNGNGLFEEIWKVNHSCRPNAVATWNEETQRMNLHALRTIRPDKEIFISYAPWKLLDFDSRDRWLRSYSYFDCKCKYCREPRAAKSMAKRKTLRDLELDCDAKRRTLTKAPEKKVQKELLKTIEEYHRLYELHIGKDVYLAHSYVDKALFFLHHGRRTVAAWESLHVAYEIFSTCYGIDHPFTKGNFITLQNVASRLREPKIMMHLIDCMSGPYMAAETVQAPEPFAKRNEVDGYMIRARNMSVKNTAVHDYPWHGLVTGWKPSEDDQLEARPVFLNNATLVAADKLGDDSLWDAE